MRESNESGCATGCGIQLSVRPREAQQMSGGIGWQEAVARLAAEKTRAETYANYLIGQRYFAVCSSMARPRLKWMRLYQD